MSSNEFHLAPELIERSFELLAPRADELVDRFYVLLFRRHPAVRPLFKNVDLDAQKKKLLAALKLVVGNVRNPERLGPTLAELGRRHEAYGARAPHYDAVASTLIDVMAEMAGPHWNPELARAWSNALQLVAKLMLEGAQSASSGQRTIRKENVMNVFGSMSLRWQMIMVMVVPVAVLSYFAMSAPAIAVPGAVFGIFVGFLVQNGVVRRLRHATEVAEAIGAGTFAGDIEVTGNDEVARTLTSLHAMHQTLQSSTDTNLTVTGDNTRTKKALDNVTANVMLADADYNIVSMNKTLTSMFRNAESDIRKDLPRFDSSKLVGTCIDEFHKDPAHQRRMLDGLDSTFESKLELGGRTFQIIANPILDDTGARSGTVVEWADLTEQMNREEDERRRVEEERHLAGENGRIKQALDKVQTNVMLADTDLNIVYLNETLLEMMKTAQSDIRKDLPNFDANRLMGTCIDAFHKDPSHQRSMLDGLRSTLESKLELGGRTFRIIANPVMDENGERLGTVVEWTDLTEQLRREDEEKQRAEQERHLAAENGRTKQALDKVTTNVMVADSDLNIVYMNETLLEMMRAAETDIRKDLPNFDTNRLMGTCIDAFHKNPAHQRGMLAGLSSTFQSQLELGGRTFRIIANPVLDENGERLGTVVEWADRTQEVAVESEVQSIVASALAGDLTQRISLEGKEGFFEALSEGVNELVAVAERVINDTVRVLGAMSRGVLTETIDADYQGAFGQLKNDANATVTKLTEVVGGIISSADAVSTAATEISQGNLNLSQRTEEQASSLEETSSSMEEMTSTVQQNADNAQQANQLALGAREQAEKGGEVVGDAVTAVAEINQSSKKIADIISVIDEIAFQTNLLALNASVEAARAGEQGRGFAVVASEVRNLAGRSATAAKEIKELIEDSVTKVEEGSKLVNDSGEKLNEIVGSVKKVTDIVAEISAASQEQASGIDQVNKAIMQMDEMTQQNAALVEEASAASESMGEQARGLTQLMSFFTVAQNAALAAGSPLGAPSAAAEIRTAARTMTTSQASAEPKSAAPTKKLKAAAGGGETDQDWEEF